MKAHKAFLSSLVLLLSSLKLVILTEKKPEHWTLLYHLAEKIGPQIPVSFWDVNLGEAEQQEIKEERGSEEGWRRSKMAFQALVIITYVLSGGYNCEWKKGNKEVVAMLQMWQKKNDLCGKKSTGPRCIWLPKTGFNYQNFKEWWFQDPWVQKYILKELCIHRGILSTEHAHLLKNIMAVSKMLSWKWINKACLSEMGNANRRTDLPGSTSKRQWDMILKKKFDFKYTVFRALLQQLCVLFSGLWFKDMFLGFREKFLRLLYNSYAWTL